MISKSTGFIPRFILWLVGLRKYMGQRWQVFGFNRRLHHWKLSLNIVEVSPFLLLPEKEDGESV